MTPEQEGRALALLAGFKWDDLPDTTDDARFTKDHFIRAAAIITMVSSGDPVKMVIAVLPDNKTVGLEILERARLLVERFKR
jgi:hypothetical protein